jgi:hypothetical protein
MTRTPVILTPGERLPVVLADGSAFVIDSDSGLILDPVAGDFAQPPATDDAIAALKAMGLKAKEATALARAAVDGGAVSVQEIVRGALMQRRA